MLKSFDMLYCLAVLHSSTCQRYCPVSYARTVSNANWKTNDYHKLSSYFKPQIDYNRMQLIVIRGIIGVLL